MSTLPTSRPRSSAARWLIPIGLVLLCGGIAVLIASGSEEVVDWMKENSTCNERPCTYDEAQSILIGLGSLGCIGGAVMLGIGFWRYLRGRDAGPALPEATAADGAPMDRLAALDAELATGRLEPGDYLSRREKILREM